MNAISKEEFKKNKQLQDAVTRRLEIMGEAGRNIPRALKEKNKHAPWFKLSLLRDLITHQYHEIRVTKIWKLVEEDIPLTKESLKKISLV